MGIGIGIGIALIAVSNLFCAGERNLPPLPELKGKDNGVDNSESELPVEDSAVYDTSPTDSVVVDGVEIDGVTPSDVIPTDQSIDTNLYDGIEEATGDAVLQELPQDIPSDQTGLDTILNDGSQDQSFPTNDYYKCLVTASDLYGMKFGVVISSENPVSYSPKGLSGTFLFSGSEGTPDSITISRLTKGAASWPKLGQSLPSDAKTYTATYQVTAEFDETDGKVKIYNYTQDSMIAGGSSVFPMTYFSVATDQPEAVAANTSNEIYVGTKPVFSMNVECSDAACLEFSGEVQKGQAGWNVVALPEVPDISSLGISCYKL